MRDIFKKFKSNKDLKISNKMMFIYVIGGFIPLLLLSFYLIGFTRNLIIDQATNEALTNAVRLEERLQDAFKTAVDVSDGVYLDADLKRLVKTQYESPEAVIKDLTEFTTFNEYLRLYDEIDSIRFYVENSSLLDNAQILKTKEKHRTSSWYQTAVELDGKMAFFYRYDEINLVYHMSMVRLIKDSQGIKVGVLVINMNNKLFRKMVNTEPYEIVGALDEDRIFISSDISKEGLSLHENKDIQRLIELESTVNEFRSHQGQFKVIKKKFSASGTENDVTLLTLIPMKTFLGYANQSIRNSTLLISVSVIVALVMVYLLTRKLSDRIEFFRANMHKVAMGDFNASFDNQGNDEIGQLFDDLKLMSSSLESLMNEVYTESQYREQLIIRQKEVEFKMLTSQIDPHFLYNTLETIRMEAIINDQSNIAEIVKKLAFIMRRKLTVSSEEVSLDSELELLKHYLEIQKFRFGDRVSYEIIRECSTEKYKILPLLLQPIVENAFIHGLEKKVGRGEIDIIISEVLDNLNIVIKDNGIGISEELLVELMEKMKKGALSSGESIGMMNVYQRIEIYYGAPYKLEISSEEGFGTTVTFCLPKVAINNQEEDSFVQCNHS